MKSVDNCRSFTGGLEQVMMRRICERGWGLLSVLICQSLVLSPVFSQQPGLRIVIVQGDSAQNVLLQIPPKPLAIRVQDANNRPVAGVSVVFTAPDSGPSGDFANDSRAI